MRCSPAWPGARTSCCGCSASEIPLHTNASENDLGLGGSAQNLRRTPMSADGRMCQRALKLPHLWAFNFPYLMGVAVSGDQPVG